MNLTEFSQETKNLIEKEIELRKAMEQCYRLLLDFHTQLVTLLNKAQVHMPPGPDDPHATQTGTWP